MTKPKPRVRIGPVVRGVHTGAVKIMPDGWWMGLIGFDGRVGCLAYHEDLRPKTADEAISTVVNQVEIWGYKRAEMERNK